VYNLNYTLTILVGYEAEIIFFLGVREQKSLNTTALTEMSVTFIHYLEDWPQFHQKRIRHKNGSSMYYTVS
jgi:hypothetical protein